MSIATVKTLDLLRKNNFIPEMVERFVKAGRFGIRKDFLGIIDIIAIDISKKPAQFLGVQSTTLSQRKSHLKTLLEDQAENSKLWLSTGSRLQLICWRKLKRKNKDGKFSKVYTWEPKIDEIKIEDLKPNAKGTTDSTTSLVEESSDSE